VHDQVLLSRRKPGIQWCLLRTTELGVQTQPSGAAEHRSHFGIERAALFELALFELDLLAARRGKSSEFGERPKWREAQEIPHWKCGTSLRVRLSFGYFSLAEQRKVSRRQGETRA